MAAQAAHLGVLIGTAVVADEEDEGVFLLLQFAQLGHDGADGLIRLCSERGIRSIVLRQVLEFFQPLLGSHVRGVHGVEGKQEEPGLGLIRLHEIDRLARIHRRGDRCASEVFEHLFAAIKGWAFAFAEITDSAHGEIKPACRGHELWTGVPEVPFADDAGGVACGFEMLRDGGFAEKEFAACFGRIGIMAGACLVAARHQTDTAR